MLPYPRATTLMRSCWSATRWVGSKGMKPLPLEEHLLVCQECRDRLEGLNVYHRAMRSALQSVPCKSVVRVRSFT
jgi:hypothetical protein